MATKCLGRCRSLSSIKFNVSRLYIVYSKTLTWTSPYLEMCQNSKGPQEASNVVNEKLCCPKVTNSIGQKSNLPRRASPLKLSKTRHGAERPSLDHCGSLRRCHTTETPLVSLYPPPSPARLHRAPPTCPEPARSPRTKASWPPPSWPPGRPWSFPHKRVALPRMGQMPSASLRDQLRPTLRPATAPAGRRKARGNIPRCGGVRRCRHLPESRVG